MSAILVQEAVELILVELQAAGRFIAISSRQSLRPILLCQLSKRQRDPLADRSAIQIIGHSATISEWACTLHVQLCVFG